MKDPLNQALLLLFTMFLLVIAALVVGVMFWWPLAVYSWNYWF